MSTRSLLLFLLISNFFFLGCASTPKARPASEFLLSTDRSATNLLADLRANLEASKYHVKKVDPSAGILVTAPRKFTYVRNGKKTGAHQTIQIRQESGSIKIRIQYDCDYAGEENSFEPCRKDDSAAGAKIARIERALLSSLKQELNKKGFRPASVELDTPAAEAD